MGCETFSLADFTLKHTTFEPFHEDTQFSASDENPLVAYKVRINYEGNLALPESECKKRIWGSGHALCISLSHD
ncbi:MAG TPA: hypothetical protein PKG55_06355 [Acidobacteriota bacterium]|nr:hypothetical protein [Acidobacteriota bacterium]